MFTVEWHRSYSEGGGTDNVRDSNAEQDQGKTSTVGGFPQKRKSRTSILWVPIYDTFSTLTLSPGRDTNTCTVDVDMTADDSYTHDYR